MNAPLIPTQIVVVRIIEGVELDETLVRAVGRRSGNCRGGQRVLRSAVIIASRPSGSNRGGEVCVTA